jgi:hypothetical protein
VADYTVAFYCIFGSVWVFSEQTAKLFRVEAAAAEMADSPAGRFEWGFVWSDTLVLGLFLLIGGLLLIGRRTRIPGHLIAFSAFAINLYATVFLSVGYWAGGRPLGPRQTVVLLVIASLGAICMVYSASVLLRPNRREAPPVHAAPPGNRRQAVHQRREEGPQP